MIEVYVKGTANSGKSTVLAVINRALNEAGLTAETVELWPDEDTSNALENLPEKMAEISRQNGTIKIIEEQMRRNNAKVSIINDQQ